MTGLGPAPAYSSRPSGFGEALYDDLPKDGSSKVVKVLWSVFLGLFMAGYLIKKVSQKSKFDKTMKVSAETEEALTPEMRSKISEKAGLGFLGSGMAVGIGALFLTIMWVV